MQCLMQGCRQCRGGSYGADLRGAIAGAVYDKPATCGIGFMHAAARYFWLKAFQAAAWVGLHPSAVLNSPGRKTVSLAIHLVSAGSRVGPVDPRARTGHLVTSTHQHAGSGSQARQAKPAGRPRARRGRSDGRADGRTAGISLHGVLRQRERYFGSGDGWQGPWKGFLDGEWESRTRVPEQNRNKSRRCLRITVASGNTRMWRDTRMMFVYTTNFDDDFKSVLNPTDSSRKLSFQKNFDDTRRLFSIETHISNSIEAKALQFFSSSKPMHVFASTSPKIFHRPALRSHAILTPYLMSQSAADRILVPMHIGIYITYTGN